MLANKFLSIFSVFFTAVNYVQLLRPHPVVNEKENFFFQNRRIMNLLWHAIFQATKFTVHVPIEAITVFH